MPVAEPKMAYVNYATLTRHLDRANFTQYIPTGSTSTYCEQFKHYKTGKLIHVLWTIRGQRVVNIKVDPGAAMEIYDQNDNAETLNIIVGDRVWDVRSKIRIRLGPLSYEQFSSFLPDQSPVAQRKEFFRLMHLVRLYIGPELKVEVQLILKAGDIPPCRSGRKGARLGWDSWVASRPVREDSEDAVFEGVDIFRVAAAS